MTTPKPLTKQRNAVFVLFLIFGIIQGTWAARLPTVRTDTNTTLDIIGLMLFTAAIGTLVGLALSPTLLAKLGVRKTIGITGAGYLLAMTFASYSSTVLETIILVMLAELFIGVTAGAGNVIINIEGASTERAIGKTLMPLMHAFFSLGMVVGAATGAIAVANNVSVFINITVLTITTGILAATVIPNLTNKPQANITKPAKTKLNQKIANFTTTFKQQKLSLIAIIILSNGLVEGAASHWLALAAVDGHKLNETNAALLYGGFLLGMTTTRFIGGEIVDRIGKTIVLQASTVASIVGIFLFTQTNSTALLLTSTILWGAGVALIWPLIMSTVADHPQGPKRVATISSLGLTTSLVGPLLLGTLAENYGTLTAISMLIVFAIIVLLAVKPALKQNS